MAESLIFTAQVQKPEDGFSVSVASSSNGSLYQRRIEFHPARKPFSSISNGGGDFHVETLNPSSDSQTPATSWVSSASTGKKSEGGDLLEYGLDPELSFGITVRRIFLKYGDDMNVLQGAGLENLGNTCFLNSVLQCLTYTEPFAAYLQSGKHQSSCHTAGFCAMCAIQKHVSRALQSTGRILAPKDLVSNLRCISRNFRNARQEDAHEYMVNLLESMHKCCLPSGVPSESPSAYEKSLVHRIFGGRLRSQVKCMQCLYCSNTFDPFLDLSLEIVKVDSLHKALTHFTTMEQLDGGERLYQCQRCKQKVKALKQLTVHKAPYVLSIHLKRFGSHVPGQKIDKKVQFGPTMNLKPFVSGSYDGDLKYTLYGVLVHAGWSTHSGHYYCFVRTSSGMWYSLDDNRVVQVSERTVLEQKAYMLFYVRDKRNFAPKKPVDVLRKENMVAYAIENKRCSASAQGPKETVQNGPIERILSTADCSATLTQRNSLGGGISKEPLLKEASAGGLVLAERSFPKKDSLLEPLVKAHLLKDPVKGPSALHSAHGQFVAEGLPPSTLSFNEASGTISYLENATGATTGAKTNPGNEGESCRKPRNLATHKLVTDKAVHENGVVLNERVLSKAPPSKDPSDKKSEKIDSIRLSKQSGIGNSQVISSILSNLSLQGQSDFYLKNFYSNFQNGGISNERCPSDTRGEKAGDIGLRSTATKSVEISSPPSMMNECVQKVALDHPQNRKRARSKKKLLTCRAASLHLGSNLLFRASLSLRKKKKHKRSKQRALELKGFTREDLGEDCISRGLGPSTSEKTRTVVLDSTHSHRQGVKSSPKKGNNRTAAKDVRDSNGGSSINSIDGDFRERIGHNSAVLAIIEPPQKSSSASSIANQWHAKEPDSSTYDKRGLVQNGLMSMLTRGLEEITVARWDGIELPPSQILGSSCAQSISIGYVPDEWEFLRLMNCLTYFCFWLIFDLHFEFSRDEEYDQGKRKKVRTSKNSFDGPNHFQEIATMKAQLKKTKMDQTSSGNRPFRI
ncbi:hypothetical protein HHK36_006380 [Tetracentron sinense]|uniref:USP domain-containing protein n=1 Tax=Tetracentron sinense TaxID=13715 RepID=A0A835DK86_TETSI|nr:hypothetical protein HHK36_006380 [Tetracentron sinense]